MTKEQEEAIEGLKSLSPSENAIETVLNMLKEKDKEIEYLKENYKNLIADVSMIAKELGLEDDGTVDEIFLKIIILKQKNEELIEKIKELEKENKCKDIFLESAKEVIENSILKQKIVNKIDELEQDIKEFESIDNTGRFKRQNSISFYKKEVLEELLENK